MKKAMSLSLETIVVAVLALFVLVAVLFFFTGGFKGLGEQFGGIRDSNCVNTGGTCHAEKIEGKTCIPAGCANKEVCCT